MANTAPKIPEQERHENLDAVRQKAQTFVDHLRKSKHFIAFTGAGVSTSAGISDFRGPKGVWTLKRQGRLQDLKTVNTLQAVPTPAHMALVELQNRGILKYLISQNCDGLHRRSGMLPDKISELHGNSNREYCKNCGKEYIRDFRAVAKYDKDDHDHRTGRKCAKCDGFLYDSIINFGESLPAQALKSAHNHAKKADLCLVLGSSLTVTPANEIPEIVGQRRGSKLAICNLQSTPIDHLSDLRVYSKTDEFMIRVMENLDIPIPLFKLHRRLVIKLETTGDERHQLIVSGVDFDGTPVTFLKSVRLENNRRLARSEPFVINYRGSLELGTLLKLELEFMGHYGEPNLDLVHQFSKEGGTEALYILEYSPHNGQWETSRLESSPPGEGTHVDVEKEDDSVLLSNDPDGVPEGLRPSTAANTFIDLTV